MALGTPFLVAFSSSCFCFFAAFFSSVVSGAAGTYLTTMQADADINTDLTIHAGQVVVVNGDREGLGAAPRWGSGGFTVQQFGSMSLTGVQLDAVRHALAVAAFYVSYGAPAFAPCACAHFWPCVWLYL